MNPGPSSTTHRARVRLDAIHKTYAGAQSPAIKQLELLSSEGEFISLLGPSGCGKTTTLRCIAGFEQPDRGSIYLNDEDITTLPPEKRDIGMVFQNYALFPHLTVYRNLAFGLEMRGIGKTECKRRIDQVLQMVQLSAMANRYPRQLSGGQQQRVALARALVIEPRLLLLDEPLANLDAVLREDMRVFIRELQQRVGITTLYVTHDQAEAMVMSDRVAVMLAGEMVQFDQPEAIYHRPRTVGVARFIGRSNVLEGTVSQSVATDGPYLRYAVDTPIGTIVGNHDEAFATGEKVFINVRPESIQFCSDGPFAAQVTAVYFLGSTVEYVLQGGAGQTLIVHTMTGPRLAVGETCRFNFAPMAPWIIRSRV